MDPDRFSSIALLMASAVHGDLPKLPLLQAMTVMITSRPELVYHFPTEVYLTLIQEMLATEGLSPFEPIIECWMLMVMKMTRGINDEQTCQNFCLQLIYPCIPALLAGLADGGLFRTDQRCSSLIARGLGLLIQHAEKQATLDEAMIGLVAYFKVIAACDPTPIWNDLNQQAIQSFPQLLL